MYRPVVLGFLALTLTAAELPRYRYAVSIPGSDLDSVAGMVTDSNGNIYIAANTKSIDLPVTPNAIQRAPRSSGLYRLRSSTAEPLLGNGALSTVLALASGDLPTTVYAGTANGLVKSNDGGDTWTQTGPFLNHPVRAIATAPSNPAVVYVSGTLGIFRSGDSGASWANVTPPTLAPYLSFSEPPITLYVSPADPNIVFAALTSFCRTTDGGASWTTLSFQSFGGTAFDSTGATLYAIGANQGVEGFYRTKDLGATWQRIGDGPDPNVTYALLTGPDPATLYAGGFNGIFRSTDSGATWTKLHPGAATAIAASPDFSTLYEVVAPNVLRSVDGGATWSTLPIPPPILPGILATSSGLFSTAGMAPQVYIAKFDPSANLIYGTYFGGSGQTSAVGIDIDSAGNALIAGQTTPVAQVSSPVFPGGPFLARINSDASRVLFSTILPVTSVSALAGSPEGGVYLSGIITAPPFEPCHPGVQNPCPPPEYIAFLRHLLPSGDTDWSTNLINFSTSTPNIVVKAAPDGGVVAATPDGNIKKFDHSGKPLGAQQITGFVPLTLAFDASGNILVGGTAIATTKASPGAYQSGPRFLLPSLPSEGQLVFNAPSDGFIVKLAPDMSMIWATHFGGESGSSVTAIGSDAAGNVVAGGTTSAHALPERLPIFGYFSSAQSGYIAKFRAQDSQLLWSTYVGDSRPFSVSSLAVDAAGNVTFSGQTLLNAASDIFISSIGPGDPAPAITLDSVVNTASRGATALSPGGLFRVQGSGFDASSARVWFDDVPVTPRQSAAGEVVVKAPSTLVGKAASVVHVDVGGVSSNVLVMPVAASAPAVYTADGSGVGQSAVFNEDGSPNSTSNPAPRGSTVTILLNGVSDEPFTVSMVFAAQIVNSSVADDITRVRVRVPDIFTQSPLLFTPVVVQSAGATSQLGVYVVLK